MEPEAGRVSEDSNDWGEVEGGVVGGGAGLLMEWALLGVATYSLRWAGSLQGPTCAEPRVWHGG